MSDDPIADLLAGCAAADRAAFRTLYRDSSAKLMGVLLRILKERAEAEQFARLKAELQRAFAAPDSDFVPLDADAVIGRARRN